MLLLGEKEREREEASSYRLQLVVNQILEEEEEEESDRMFIR